MHELFEKDGCQQKLHKKISQYHKVFIRFMICKADAYEYLEKSREYTPCVFERKKKRLFSCLA